MTNEEAIKELQGFRQFVEGTRLSGELRIEAIDMAIEALKEQRPHGEWIKFECGYETHSKCSECHNTNTWGEVTYCPWCGSRNVKGGDGK